VSPLSVVRSVRSSIVAESFGNVAARLARDAQYELIRGKESAVMAINQEKGILHLVRMAQATVSASPVPQRTAKRLSRDPPLLSGKKERGICALRDK